MLDEQSSNAKSKSSLFGVSTQNDVKTETTNVNIENVYTNNNSSLFYKQLSAKQKKSN